MRQLCRHVEIIAAIIVSNHFIFVQCLFNAHCILCISLLFFAFSSSSSFVCFSLSLYLQNRFVLSFRVHRLQLNSIPFNGWFLIKLPFIESSSVFSVPQLVAISRLLLLWFVSLKQFCAWIKAFAFFLLAFQYFSRKRLPLTRFNWIGKMTAI